MYISNPSFLPKRETCGKVAEAEEEDTPEELLKEEEEPEEQGEEPEQEELAPQPEKLQRTTRGKHQPAGTSTGHEAILQAMQQKVLKRPAAKPPQKRASPEKKAVAPKAKGKSASSKGKGKVALTYQEARQAFLDSGATQSEWPGSADFKAAVAIMSRAEVIKRRFEAHRPDLFA